MMVFSRSDWNQMASRSIGGWNRLAGHYCEFPAGDVNSPVFCVLCSRSEKRGIQSFP
jgi:hypothetical protein